MIVPIFLIWSLAILFAWCGFRRTAMLLTVFNLGLCVFWFNHHITDALNIQL